MNSTLPSGDQNVAAFQGSHWKFRAFHLVTLVQNVNFAVTRALAIRQRDPPSEVSLWLLALWHRHTWKTNRKQTETGSWRYIVFAWVISSHLALPDWMSDLGKQWDHLLCSAFPSVFYFGFSPLAPKASTFVLYLTFSPSLYRLLFFTTLRFVFPFAAACCHYSLCVWVCRCLFAYWLHDISNFDKCPADITWAFLPDAIRSTVTLSLTVLQLMYLWTRHGPQIYNG